MRSSELAINPKYEHLWHIANQANPPLLSLRIKNGNSASHNKVLHIDALGLQGDDNLRKTRDGHVYFGTLKHSLPDSKGNLEVLNDYVLPATSMPVSRDPKAIQQLLVADGCDQKQPRHRGRQMQVFFSVAQNGFVIEDLGVGMGTYLRVDRELRLDCNELINIGTSLLLVSQMDLDDQGQPFLKAKVCGGPNNGKIFSLNPVPGKNYVLGRSENCDLHLSDCVLSQRHCIFRFETTVQDTDTQDCSSARVAGTAGAWVLEDGNCGKRSLNGTWVYLKAPTLLQNKMTIKVSEILFEASVTNTGLTS
jgi:hypothetical protein